MAVLAVILIAITVFPGVAKMPGTAAFNPVPSHSATVPQKTVTPGPTLTPSPTSTPAPTPSPVENAGNEPPARPAYDNTNRPQYDIQIRFDEKSHTATASQTIRYTNTVKDSLNEVYLHIYPNHFSKKEYVKMYFNTTSRPVYPDNRFNPGSIAITSVKAAGKDVKYKIQGKDRTVLRIPISTPLLKGQTILLNLTYKLQVPNRMGRFAWGETGTSFANWYPVLAVYDRDGWNLDPYYELGDPFYSEAADYKVTIDMPEGMEAAFTGDVVSDAVKEGRRVLALSETGVRDFAFVLSRKYIIQKQTVDGIEVRVAMPKADRAMMAQVMGYATKALSIYNRKFGKYTNDTLTVAFVDDYGGMEYPGIVFIQETLLNTKKDTAFLTSCVVHEIAHQWWYGAVGNDEVEEPWLDESLTSFSELVYKHGGKSMAGADLSAIKPSGMLQKGLPEYKSYSSYRHIYTFGKDFFVKLMLLMGEDRFYTMLRKYYTNYAYGIATTEDLRALVIETGCDEAVKWFERCVYGKEVSG